MKQEKFPRIPSPARSARARQGGEYESAVGALKNGYPLGLLRAVACRLVLVQRIAAQVSASESVWQTANLRASVAATRAGKSASLWRVIREPRESGSNALWRLFGGWRTEFVIRLVMLIVSGWMQVSAKVPESHRRVPSLAAQLDVQGEPQGVFW